MLPFQNMSGDPEQDYFADGIVEDIITALSRFKSFAVIARNSSFIYKGRAVDVRQVAKELGVRYVLEGSVGAAATGCASLRSSSTASQARIFGRERSTARWRTFSTCRIGSPRALLRSSSRISRRRRSNAHDASGREACDLRHLPAGVDQDLLGIRQGQCGRLRVVDRGAGARAGQRSLPCACRLGARAPDLDGLAVNRARTTGRNVQTWRGGD